MLSPPKPLDEIQPNLMCELLTLGCATAYYFWLHPLVPWERGQISLNFNYKFNIREHSGWVLDSRPKGRGFRASPASMRYGPRARHIYPSLVLVQHRKTRPCLTERLLMGPKESNQTNKQKTNSISKIFIPSSVSVRSSLLCILT